MANQKTRYVVFSKALYKGYGEPRSLKNAATREAARQFKRNQKAPTAFGIYDRTYGEVVR